LSSIAAFCCDRRRVPDGHVVAGLLEARMNSSWYIGSRFAGDRRRVLRLAEFTLMYVNWRRSPRAVRLIGHLSRVHPVNGTAAGEQQALARIDDASQWQRIAAGVTEDLEVESLFTSRRSQARAELF
jgi:hypothetical protein